MVARDTLSDIVTAALGDAPDTIPLPSSANLLRVARNSRNKASKYPQNPTAAGEFLIPNELQSYSGGN